MNKTQQILICSILVAAAISASSSVIAEEPNYGPPPCKDVIVNSEGEQVCTTDKGIKFTKRGNAWFRVDKLHRKPLGGRNSAVNVVGRSLSKTFGW